LARAESNTAGETNSTFVTCGKPADVVDDNGAKLFSLGEFERLILEPGWVDKSKKVGKRNVLVPAVFPTHQNTRAWINSYSIAAIADCEHYADIPADKNNDFADRKAGGPGPVNVEAGNDYRICAEEETAVIYTTDLKDSGITAGKFEKIYLEAGWKENAKQIKLSKKKKFNVTPVAFPARGFIRGYIRSEMVAPLQECAVYKAQLAKLDERARKLELHEIALSDQYGGYASEDLRAAARYALLEKLYAPMKTARTDEAEKIRELIKIKDGILKAAEDADQAMHEAYLKQVAAYQAYQTASGAADAAESKAKDSNRLYTEQVREPQRIIDGIDEKSPLEMRIQLGPAMITKASAAVVVAFANWEAKNLRLSAEVARKASYEASMEYLRTKIAAIRARAEANRYRISFWPLPLNAADLTEIAALQKELGILVRYMPDINNVVANAKTASENAYNARRAVSARQMVQFMLQVNMDQAMTAKASAETDYKKALSDWQTAEAEVSDARMILRLTTDNGRSASGTPPDELATAQKRLADAQEKSAKLYVELAKVQIQSEQANLKAEQTADRFLSNFISDATEKANDAVTQAQTTKTLGEAELARRENHARAAQDRVNKIMALLRELLESNKDIRRAKTRKEDAEIDATVAENMVKQAQKNSEKALADLRAHAPGRIYSDSRVETYQENMAQEDARRRYEATFEAEELVKIEPLKVKVAEEHLRAAKLKVEEMEARAHSAELILKIEEIKNDPAGAQVRAKCAADLETAKADLASAQSEVTEKEENLKAANEAKAATEARAKEAREVITKGNERVRDSAARQEMEQKSREDAAAQAAKAEQDAREAQWKKMAALYPPGFETARTEAAKNYEKWARKRIKDLGLKAEEKGIPWQEQGLEAIPGEIPDEMIEEMVDKYKGAHCHRNDTDELKCMACNVWFEARNQDYEGKMLSGRTAMNRVKSKAANVPTVCGTIYQWKWYSWANILKTNPEARALPGPKSGEFHAFPEVVKAAIQTLQEETPYILNHYWAVGSAPRPWQNKTMCVLTRVRIDSHYACYLPLGEDPLEMREIRDMLANDPELLGRDG
jgi:hypothetical protein